MSTESTFADLIRRVRAGEQEAAAELVRRYEPVIRRTVRVRLADDRLERLFDSMDICQSVLGSFFVRAALGQYDLERPDDLLKLLTRMARNKVADHARHERAERRDHRRLAGSGLDDQVLASPETSPSQKVAGQELLEKFRERLQPDERDLADQRADGHEWRDIAAKVGSTPEALRKKLERAIVRIAQELGVEEVVHV